MFETSLNSCWMGRPSFSIEYCKMIIYEDWSSLSRCENFEKDRNTRDHKERESHARGVYLTQDTLCMETVGVNQEEEADTIMIRNKK